MIELQLDEVRRLTGPSLLWDKPGAIIDVLLGGIDPQQVLFSLQRWTQNLLAELGWQHESRCYRLHEHGLNFAISAPLDALYGACDVLELAWLCSASELQDQALPEWKSRLDEIRQALVQEQNPALLALVASAKQRAVPCLIDDDECSLGMGASTHCWPLRALPLLTEINWAQYHASPRAMITGTNGKSTSVRLAAHIAKLAGICAGVTSTDFIRIGDDIVDYGDYSGPAGARMVLRDRRCELAFLEVARGGILRRGLPVDRVDAALITNVARDHLGQYGINTVEELAQTKFVVSKALDAQGVLVLNADDPQVIHQAHNFNKAICWFSVDEQNTLIQQQLASGGRAVFVRNGELIYHQDRQFEHYGQTNLMPLSFANSAAHNIQNALGVVGLCKALALPNQAIIRGLQEFGRDPQDNPGRGNMYQISDYHVIVDFAHNQHGVQAVVNMVKQLPAKQIIVMFSHGGDRSNQDIQALTETLTQLNADLYIAAEIEKYLRGREPGEVPALSKHFLLQHGINAEQIMLCNTPLAGAQLAISKAQHGAMVVLFVLEQREEVQAWLAQQIMSDANHKGATQ
jgi:cyanophycin synthetase